MKEADDLGVWKGGVATEQYDHDGSQLVKPLAEAELISGDAALLKEGAADDGRGVLALDLDVVGDPTLVGDAKVKNEPALPERGRCIFLLIWA